MKNSIFGYIELYTKELAWLVAEMAPWLLLGFLIAGVLHVFFPENSTNRYFGKQNFGSVLRATLLGIPLPLCSCGVIPTGISIYKNGASKGSALSFMISTPQTGVDSIMLTYSMLGLPFALIRPIVAFITGLAGGIFGNAVLKNEKKVAVKEIVISDSEKKQNPVAKMLHYAFITLVQDIAKWLLLGILLAALISVIIPDNFFSDIIQSNVLGIFTLLIISIPLYVCATGSIPIAAVLMMKGFSPGAALVFLMAGPATNIATMSVIGNAMGKKSLLVYMITIISGAVLSGLFVDAFLPAEWFNIVHHSHDHQEMIPEWIKISSGIILGALILYALIRKYFPGLFSSKKVVSEKNEAIAISVKGMNCEKCSANVHLHLSQLDGIDSVEVDLKQEIAYIKADNPDLEKIKETVESLGYKFGGVK